MRIDTDPARPSGRVLWQDGVRQSYLDLHDPTYLHFAYTQRVADAVDTVFAPGKAVVAVHLGGGGLTLPRWLAATRPASTSTVFELDPEVVHTVLGLVHVPAVTVRVVDGRAGLAALGEDHADLVVGDAFVGRRVPEHLLTAQCVAEIIRVLRPGGLYVLNLIDDPPLDRLGAALAAVRSAFSQVGVVAARELLTQGMGGNAVIVASDTPVDWVDLAHRAALRSEQPDVLGPGATAAWLGR